MYNLQTGINERSRQSDGGCMRATWLYKRNNKTRDKTQTKGASCVTVWDGTGLSLFKLNFLRVYIAAIPCHYVL